MNNGSSYGNNRNNNQQGKSYRGYYGGSKSSSHKKNFTNNRYNQRPIYDQSRHPYVSNNANVGSIYQGNGSGSNYSEGLKYTSSTETYDKKPHQNGNNHYTD